MTTISDLTNCEILVATASLSKECCTLTTFAFDLRSDQAIDSFSHCTLALPIHAPPKGVLAETGYADRIEQQTDQDAGECRH